MPKYSLKKVYENEFKNFSANLFASNEEEVLEEGLKQELAFGLAGIIAAMSGYVSDGTSSTQYDAPPITMEVERDIISQAGTIQHDLQIYFEELLDSQKENISFNSDDDTVETVSLTYREILMLCFIMLNIVDENPSNSNQGFDKNEVISILNSTINESSTTKLPATKLVNLHSPASRTLEKPLTPKRVGTFLGHDHRFLSSKRQSGFLEGLVNDIVKSENLNQFINNFFLLLYSKTVRKLNIDQYSDPKRNLGDNVEELGYKAKEFLNILFETFIGKIAKSQTKFTVFYGTFFEEIFEHKIKSQLSGNASEFVYSPDFSIAGKKISIILILFKTGLFAKSSSYKRLKDNQKITDSDYVKDYKILAASMIGDINGLDNIINMYTRLLNTPLNNIACSDTEKDEVIKKYINSKSITQTKNLPFDYIIRNKNVSAGQPSNFGLFDLKAYNVKSKSSLLSQAKTGNNKNNSALKFINEVIASLKKENKDVPVSLSFFGLIQVSYELKKTRGKNELKFNILEIDYKTAPALDSFVYSEGRKFFYLAYTPAGQNNPKKIYDGDNLKDDKPENQLRGYESTYINPNNFMNKEVDVSYAKHQNNTSIMTFIKSKLNNYNGNIWDYIDHTNLGIILPEILLNADYFKLINDIKSQKTFESIFIDEQNTDSNVDNVEVNKVKDLYDFIKIDDNFDPVRTAEQLYKFLINDFESTDTLSTKLSDMYKNLSPGYKRQNFKRSITRYLVAIYGKSNKNYNMYEFHKDIDEDISKYPISPASDSSKQDLQISSRDNKYANKMNYILNKYIEAYNEHVESEETSAQNSSFFRKGKVLKEVYSNLFQDQHLQKESNNSLKKVFDSIF